MLPVVPVVAGPAGVADGLVGSGEATDWLPIPSVLFPARWAVATRLSPG